MGGTRIILQKHASYTTGDNAGTCWGAGQSDLSGPKQGSSQAPTLGGTRIILQKPASYTTGDDVGTCWGAN
jgi:hypothetical protein